MTIPIRRVRALTPKVYEGAQGVFSGGLPGEPLRTVQGVIVKIMEGPNYAVVSVRTTSGTVLLKM